VQHSQFIVFARAKGLNAQQIYWRHIAKNTIPLIFNYLPSLIISLFSGSFLVEMIFSIPGLGFLFSEAILARDYPLVLGITLVLGLLMILLSQIFHQLFLLSDPRIQEGVEA
jgi:oligopeptide transport system permease protein